MAELEMTKLIPVTVKYDGIGCSDKCPQLEPLIGSNAYICRLDGSYMHRFTDTKRLMRTDECISRFCNDTEPNNQRPTHIQRKAKLTDPIDCPRCGCRANVANISASSSPNDLNIKTTYYCTSHTCENRYGFVKEETR